MKRWWISLAFAATLALSTFLAAVAWQRFSHDASLKSDLGRMQGRWESTIEGMKVMMTVEGSQMSLLPELNLGLVERVLMTLSGGGMSVKPERGTLRLDPSLSPKAIDLIGQNGRIRPGIYALYGRTFKLCLWTGATTAPRPASFDAAAKGYSLYVFRRTGR